MIWTLIPVSLIYGIVAALVFRRFSDAQAVRLTGNRMLAHVLEFRLFVDSPSLVFRAQRELARENLRLLRLILLPCVILAAIFLLLFPQLDAMYGHTPLPPGRPSVVTANFEGNATLEAPPGIAVETPAVHSTDDRQISWRIRPLGEVTGDLKLHAGGRVATKQIVAGSGLIDAYTTRAITVHYPSRHVLGTNWMVWFFLLSSVAAIVNARTTDFRRVRYSL